MKTIDRSHQPEMYELFEKTVNRITLRSKAVSSVTTSKTSLVTDLGYSEESQLEKTYIPTEAISLEEIPDVDSKKRIQDDKGKEELVTVVIDKEESENSEIEAPRAASERQKITTGQETAAEDESTQNCVVLPAVVEPPSPAPSRILSPAPSQEGVSEELLLEKDDENIDVQSVSAVVAELSQSGESLNEGVKGASGEPINGDVKDNQDAEWVTHQTETLVDELEESEGIGGVEDAVQNIETISNEQEKTPELISSLTKLYDAV
ncbi:hypothetical protein D5R81_09460 [Parashewanella spongiae]|uniref:Uncharacterized protein n=1 Tax=Parashewanella spongiae TaxID=342950 RepID=A0A3A6TTX7_9GAMM|nr:hypothetical protein [Parashewanella spongiae]MCL1078119.1 hypothetical protein [Parashewanella spongiae]RJY16365.1 hypothetical protein D5R81_09460 [Parashewanella spongiae]